MDAGFTVKDRFLIDTFCHREKRPLSSTGMRRCWLADREYSPAVVKVHQHWSDSLVERSYAKVEILFGSANRKLAQAELPIRTLTIHTAPPVSIQILLLQLDRIGCHSDGSAVEHCSTARRPRP